MTRRPITLQTRLTLTVLGMVSALLLLVGLVTAGVLRGVLDRQFSTQVSATASRIIPKLDTLISRAGLNDAVDMLTAMHNPTNVVLLVSHDDGTVTGAYTRSNGAVERVSKEAVMKAVASYDSPNNGSSEEFGDMEVDAIGPCRMAATRAGDGATVLVGLPLSTLEQQATALVPPVLFITAGGLLLLGVATVMVVSSGLRPLRNVVATAERVSSLKLDQGEGAIPDRVPDAAVDNYTEIGRVGAALNTMLDNVETSMRARAINEDLMRQFVADASHELRTPLAAIRGYSELSLRNTENPETTSAALERIQTQSLRMTRLVEDLLLLARLGEGGELALSPVDLAPLAIEALADAQVAGDEHEWELDLDTESVTVMGDAGRLHQVVGNLLTNARTHTPSGTQVTLRLSTHGSDALLQVHDNGPGIDPVVRDALFERFARADKSRARKSGGTGLGLSIARAIADAHGGSLEVESTPGNTTFTLRLPLTAPVTL